MKNSIIWKIGCVLLLLSACRTGSTNLAVPGVSRELAAYRKARITALSYSLFFRIPEEAKEEIPARVSVKFVLHKPDSVILDFRETVDKLQRITVNGQQGNYRIGDEHIVLAAQQMEAGENEVLIDFIAGEQSLNRNDDYLYTLLVPDRARTLFPCFDQPDLKARYTLTLELPEEWKAVSNAPLKESREKDGRRQIVFAETEPLSTYLFSFVAGRFEQAFYTEEGRDISVYHRETDPQKLAQLPLIADQVFAALNWMEDYTGIPYPFAKYDLIILPGFQFGGMEHTGATLYNDKRMFLPAHPTVGEELGRAELIAHETAHMWFGDYVTMQWFDDVWTKEVFANYFAARMVEPLFPSVNHDLNALKGFYASAYSEDRTQGSNAIKQPLDNLKNAGLIYGQIIYNKAPVVMKMLVERMGEEAFRQGIREYLSAYAYSNADWEGLIRILDVYTPEDLTAWSRVWVHEKGMPEVLVQRSEGKVFLVQKDPFGRGLCWPQPVGVLLVKGDSIRMTVVQMENGKIEIPGAGNFDYVVPGYDGKAYGYFAPDPATLTYCLEHIRQFTDPVTRLAVVMMLNENQIRGRIDPAVFLDALLFALPEEKNRLVYSSLCQYISSVGGHPDLPAEKLGEAERILLSLSRQNENGEARLTAFRTLLNIFRTPEPTAVIYDFWEKQTPFDGLALNENDYRKMAYELAVRFPEKARDILALQEGRITHPDRLREFRFIARALDPEEAVRDSLFCSLLLAENRRIEPWTGSVLAYLNHPLRQKQARKYIRPSLEILQEVQRTGDIFFPKNWVSACLRGHHSLQAADSVQEFLQRYPDYPPLLKNKILQSADPLFRLKANKKEKRSGKRSDIIF